MRRRIDLGQQLSDKEEARFARKRQRWAARNKGRPSIENPFLAAIKPDHENYGDSDERSDELRIRLENLEFGNFPGYFNYRNNATLGAAGGGKGGANCHETDGDQANKLHSPGGDDHEVAAGSDTVSRTNSGPTEGSDETTSAKDRSQSSPLEDGLSDERLRLMREEWFKGKDVLDIGCNRGHITYALAKRYSPKFIVGIDIDLKMINMANRDLHLHLEDDLLRRSIEFRCQRAAQLRLSSNNTSTADSKADLSNSPRLYDEEPNQFPLSSYILHGPLAIHPVDNSTTNDDGDAHADVVRQEDRTERERVEATVSRAYETQTTDSKVSDPNTAEQQQQQQTSDSERTVSKDELLEKQRPFFDTIVCLSVTKWIHLNYRDAGLKRFFKRIYRHLKPGGGLLVLEVQPFDNYFRRKKMCDRLRANYYSITFKPDQFDDYLLSAEVGFSQILYSTTTDHQCAGFKRPLKVFLKK